MVLNSDISLDLSKFDPNAVTSQQHEFNEQVEKNTRAAGRWYEIGAPTFRKMREQGKTPVPPRTVLDDGINVKIPSREPGRDIPCRLFFPTSGAQPVGIFLHLHGGGWVLQSELDFDPYLKNLSGGSGADIPLVAVTVGYRLAPENVFPAGPQDCHDVAEWLTKHSESDVRFGKVPLRFIGGESAGGHLTMSTALYLLGLPKSYTGLKGLVSHFGAFSLNRLPACVNFKEELVLTDDIMQAYISAVTPAESKADPGYVMRADVSPIYADLQQFRGKLPPALFTCGTMDPLIDDTLLMSMKWMVAGVKDTYVKIFPGQPHGFVFFDREQNPAAGQANQAVGEFIKQSIS